MSRVREHLVEVEEDEEVVRDQPVAAAVEVRGEQTPELLEPNAMHENVSSKKCAVSDVTAALLRDSQLANCNAGKPRATHSTSPHSPPRTSGQLILTKTTFVGSFQQRRSGMRTSRRCADAGSPVQ